jgi:hypothetical protein
LKLKLDKSVDELKKRLDAMEEETSGQETDYQIEARFSKLREARAKKTDAFGNKTYEDVWDNITQEELDYYKRRNLEILPEKVSDEKELWDFHDSSWSVRELNRYDGYGCNQFTGCVLECKYYPQERRIEDEEVLSSYENKRKRE